MRSHRSTLYRTLTALGTAGLLAAGALSLPADATSARTPYGTVDALYQYGSGIAISGRAVNPQIDRPATVYIRVDYERAATTLANLSHPSTHDHSGFRAVVPLRAGLHQVCATTYDPAGRRIVILHCAWITLNYDPVGAISAVTQSPGRLTATGWALDRDTPRLARPIAILVDGHSVASGTANRTFAGLSKAHPVAGDLHGFTLSFPVAQGAHRICLQVSNSGAGATALVQCVTRTVNFSPVGGFRTVSQIPGGVSVAGYAADPDTTATTTVTVTANGVPLGTVPANGQFGFHPGYGFLGNFLIPGSGLAPGVRNICVIAHNLGTYGTDRTLQCWAATLNFNPTAGISTAAQQSPGALVTGWATDPDTTAPISVQLSGDGKQLATVPANGATGSHPGHMFSAVVPLGDGTHTVCVTAINARYGSGNSAPKCAQVSLNFSPYGKYESVTRVPGSTNVTATGWAIDPDTTASLTIRVSVDFHAPTIGTANVDRPDVAAAHPGTGAAHGFAITVPASDTEHTVCVRAMNVLGGATSPLLGCKIVNAVHPVVPSAPTQVTAVGGYGGAHIAWTAPASDGGAPWSGYTIRALPSGPSMTVSSGALAATLLGLKPSTQYTFSVVATNVAGSSAAGVSNAVLTQREPPAQTTPAPISTSRYIRNVHGAASTDLAAMRAEGASDAAHNPSGHGYLVVLAVGGQDESRHGVVLTAGIRFVSYADMVRDLDAYIDGYASQQRPSAPVTLAIATNNDIDVSHNSGVSFADNIVDPVRAHAASYPGITIAGSDDMEPGFRAGYTTTSYWLQGYLAATTAPFVFTGSADGCSWTATFGSCNNGWSMRGMYYLAAGANPIQVLNLPQIYNSTMAQQWRYISLTGVEAGRPKIDFGGALTEYTACLQARSCGSLTGNVAWTYMWNQLNADPRLRPSTLPYSTDLRIDS